MAVAAQYSLFDGAITTAVTGEASDAVEDLEGMIACTVQFRFAYGSGGTSLTVYLQTQLDADTWVDIACVVFGTATETAILNFSGLTPKTTQVTPTDGALTNDTAVDGILGSKMRIKRTSVGTYANSTLSVRLTAR